MFLIMTAFSPLQRLNRQHAYASSKPASRIYALLLFLLATSVSAQNMPSTPAGKPDFSGIWQSQGTTAVEGGELPYQPWALAQQQQNLANREQADPLNHCYFPGVPRIMTLDHPFQIFQAENQLAMAFEWTQVFRLVYMDGGQSVYSGVESWMGHSRGHWEGDVLVVTVSDMNNKTWFDAVGNFHSNALQLTERYRLLDADTIEYAVTADDPKVFTRPWTMRLNLYRQKELPRVLEYQCQAEKEEVTGDFARDERTWYPAQIQDDYTPFDNSAGLSLPLPVPASDIVRLADGTPDISGYFMADPGGANYGLEAGEGGFLLPRSRGIVVDPPDGILPYQAWARAERVDRLEPYRGYDDPTAHCFVAGLPRSFYVPSPFYMVQTQDAVTVLHERMAWRLISLVRKELLPDSIRLWQGDSLGHWEGDTLVVQSSNFNGKAWLNEAGDVISHMEQLKETFTPVSRDRIIYRATVSDPIAYTRPWTIEVPFDRMEDELLEVACLEDNNDLQHLKDVRDEHRATLKDQ